MSKLIPASITAGNASFTLTVTGTKFMDGASVLWIDAKLPTTLVAANKLTAKITADKLSVTGTVTIKVRNPAPTASALAALNFVITPH